MYRFYPCPCCAEKLFTVSNTNYERAFNGQAFTEIEYTHTQKAWKFCSLERRLIINVSTRADKVKNTILTFSDNGMGLDLNRYRDRLFGLYQRFHTDTEGSGLGLFISKSQIEALNGKIEIESEPDKGATFIITFPASCSP